jgi:hypothetical protein
MYGDALVGILPKQAGSLIRPENTQAFFLNVRRSFSWYMAKTGRSQNTQAVF